MKYFKKLKTSQKLSITFSIFNFFSLLVLLLAVNISYFFIWYSNIKQESLYDMNVNYNSYLGGMQESNKKAFREYILSKDTIITPHDGTEMVCSAGVSDMLHDDPEEVKKVMNSFFYKIEDKTYFVFKNDYEDIGEVSILYDTTDYFNSQVIIIKVSLVIILISILLNYLLGKYISGISLRQLKNISKEVIDINLDKDIKKLDLSGPDDDEIRILGEALNQSFSKLKTISENQKQFIVDVSHEVKTPLMVINSKIDLFIKAKKASKNQNIDLLFDDIKKHIKKLNSLLETLFLISRIEDYKIKLDFQDIDIKENILNIVNDISIAYSDKDINLSLDIDKGFKLKTDISLFSIFFSNLISNSIKFTGEKVEIYIKAKGNSIILQDNGIGIKKQDIDKIWDKFYRIDKNIEGFGVGLFLIKRISKLFSWDIKVESQINNGTKFIIKIK